MSLKREILVGTIWSTAARWGIRALGVVSTVILARLLAPDDFGLIALATMFAGTIAIFGEVGLFLHLIRMPDPDRSHFDTVWTLRTILGTALGAVIYLAGPWAADWFNDPRLILVVQSLALTSVLQGLQNPGIVWFRKNLDFRRDFAFMVGQKIASFTVTLTLAFVLRDYRALLAGILAGNAAGLVLSYTMHPYRPRPRLSQARGVWSFSLWVLVHQIVVYLVDRVDIFLVGRFRNTTDVGLYSVAQDLATSPVAELALPFSRVLFPAYSKIVDDREQLAHIFARVLAGMAVLVFAMGPGMALVAPDAVAVVLGAKWTAAAPLIQVLAGSAVVFGLSHPIFPLLTALGRPKVSAYISVVQLGLLVAAMLPAVIAYGLAEVALARFVAMLLSLLVTVGIFVRVAHIDARAFVLGLWPPAVAACVMAALVVGAQAISPDLPALRLAIAIAVGGAAYVGTLLVLWILRGRPNTVEADLVAFARLQGLLGRPARD